MRIRWRWTAQTRCVNDNDKEVWEDGERGEEETFINKVEEAPNSGKERNLWFAIPRKIV